jgi:Ni/Co efflux regulator RcnB
MKQLLTIVLALFAFSAFAAEPATTPGKAPTEMKLAKKKDHSKDKKVDATKSTADKKAATKKSK